MEKNNKSLIEYKRQSIISKVFSFFKSLFFKKNKNEIANLEKDFTEQKKRVIQDDKESNNSSISDEIKIRDEKVEEFVEQDNSKVRFFSIYNKFKDNNLEINDVSTYDIVRIYKMLEEENNLIMKK